MTAQLSEGALERILAGETGEAVQDVILQVVGFKHIPPASNGPVQVPRYRLILTDGVIQHTYGMLSSQLNHLIETKELEPFAIIRAKKYVCNSMNPEKKILVVMDIDIVKPGSEVGRVIEATSGRTALGAINGKSAPPARGGGTVTGSTIGESRKRPRESSGPPPGHNAVVPISMLTPYQNAWTIKARVTNKGPIRTWSKASGDGKLFSFDLLDETGEIRATAFNDQCDKYYSLIEPDCVYYISKAQLRPAKKQFSSIKNDYELSLTSSTLISPCDEADDDIPRMNYNFVTIDKLQSVPANELVDVVAVVKSASDVQTFNRQSDGTELTKRDITLIDQSLTQVNCTLWGNEAINFDGSTNPVVAIRGAKTSQFNGVTLSLPMSAVMQKNPDIREACVLRGWWDNEGHTAAQNAKSLTTDGNAGGSDNSTEMYDFTSAELRVRNLTDQSKGLYFRNKATVSMIKKDNLLYQACPSSNCNKKVLDQGNGEYRCEKCQRAYPNFSYRIMMQLCLQDAYGQQWCSAFGDQAERLLGTDSETLGRYSEEDRDRYDSIIRNATLQQFIFKLRARMDMFNEEQRYRVVVVDAKAIDYAEYGHILLKEIQENLKI